MKYIKGKIPSQPTKELGKNGKRIIILTNQIIFFHLLLLTSTQVPFFIDVVVILISKSIYTK